MEKYYERWSDEECIRIFAKKNTGDFFKSEIYHITKILPEIKCVLDVGCASGRFISLLKELGIRPEYVGIDISSQNIKNATRLYPNSTFYHCNALEFKTDKLFDLVNATGVCQHEPKFENLIEVMTKLSKKYVLFDVKFSRTSSHIININKSYAGSKKNRLYFIVLNIDRFVSYLSKLKNISKISIYGYETTLNSKTHVPNNIKNIISAGILLTIGRISDKPTVIDYHIPKGLL